MILSDRQIKNLSGKPEVVTHFLPESDIEYFSRPFTEYENRRMHASVIVKDYDAETDTAFRAMIEPFVPHQVREQRNARVQEDMDECLRELERVQRAQQTATAIIFHQDTLKQKMKELAQEENSLRRRIDILNMNPNEKIVSYGLSAYGYDIRLAPEYMIASNVTSGIIDPKNPDEKVWVPQDGPSVLVPPNGFMLSRSMEYMRMPKDVLAVVLSKSTYARVGINCLATPLEPGWEGHITLEFANTTPNPVRMYGNEGCCQLLFFKGEECMTPYDQARKYFGQTGITLARV